MKHFNTISFAAFLLLPWFLSAQSVSEPTMEPERSNRSISQKTEIVSPPARMQKYSDNVSENAVLLKNLKTLPLQERTSGDPKQTTPNRNKWNAEGNIFLSMYGKEQTNPSKNSKGRIYLENTFGLTTKANGSKGIEDYLPVIIHFSDLQSIQEAESYGFLPQSVSNFFCTGLLPLRNVSRIESIEGIIRINASTKAKPFNDLSRKASKVDSVQENLKTGSLSKSYNGKDVIVGIIDIGFDFTNPTFFDNSDNYRVARVWDQNKTGTAPDGYNYGTEYTSSQEILAAQHDSYSGESHGTHVAGTAAGSGGSTVYKGMADGSELVLVSTTMSNSTIYDGVNYIFDYAESQNKPCVINMSLGSDIGAHDGTSAMDQLLDMATGKGRILVASAGNSGGDTIHLRISDLNSGNSSLFSYSISDPSLPAIFDFWADENSDDFVLFPGFLDNANNFIYTTLYSNSNETYSYVVTPDNDTIASIIYSAETDRYNHKKRITTYIYYASSDMEQNYLPAFQVQSLGNTSLHAWCSNAAFTDNINCDIDPEYTHSAQIASASQVLSVAAYVTRSSWTAASGQGYYIPGYIDNDIAPFSSRGPLANGTIKPDIAAPGARIVSSANSFDLTDYGSSLVETSQKDGKNFSWICMQGTSMSAPAVTGIVALLLEKAPDMDMDSLKKVLLASAQTDSYTGNSNYSKSSRWGVGKIDAFRALKYMETGEQGDLGYYASAIGKTGFALKTALHDIIKDHTVKTYSELKTAMETTDAKNGNEVWDIYSNCTFTYPDAWAAEANSECEGINREHSFPKSWFGVSSDTYENYPIYTDLFHLYPTDIFANSQRSNYPLGEVREASWTGSISKLGSSATDGYNSVVFEPADEYKGDLARSYFYIATRYQDMLPTMSTSVLDGSSDFGIAQWAIDMLLEWHNNDPVSQKEIDRNEAIYAIQGNRNPFIDNPEWANEIWGNSAKPAVKTSDLILSEYVSGLFYGKPQRAIEIYNGTASPIDLSSYILKFERNGSGGYTYELPLRGFIHPYSTFYVANNDQVEEGKMLFADQFDATQLTFDGNDAIGLFKNGELIDAIGTLGSSSFWGRDVVLRRKTSVTQGSPSYNASEWDNFNCNLTGDFGYHGAAGPNATTLISADGISATQILISFSRELKPASLTASSFTVEDLSDGNFLAVEKAEINGNTILLTLSEAMKFQSYYRISMPSLFDIWNRASYGYNTTIIFLGDAPDDPNQCRSIRELLGKDADKTTVYTLLNPVAVTALGSQYNQKWIQDNTAGIIIHDPNHILTEQLSVGDNLTGLKGTLSTYFGAYQFTPTENLEKDQTASLTISPTLFTCSFLNESQTAASYQSQLIRIEKIKFLDAGKFENGKSYRFTDGVDTAELRIHIYNTDLTGMNIPQGFCNLTGLMVLSYEKYYIAPRSASDIEIFETFDLTATFSVETEAGKKQLLKNREISLYRNFPGFPFESSVVRTDENGRISLSVTESEYLTFLVRGIQDGQTIFSWSKVSKEETEKEFLIPAQPSAEAMELSATESASGALLEWKQPEHSFSLKYFDDNVLDYTSVGSQGSEFSAGIHFAPEDWQQMGISDKSLLDTIRLQKTISSTLYQANYKIAVFSGDDLSEPLFESQSFNGLVGGTYALAKPLEIDITKDLFVLVEVESGYSGYPLSVLTSGTVKMKNDLVIINGERSSLSSLLGLNVCIPFELIISKPVQPIQGYIVERAAEEESAKVIGIARETETTYLDNGFLSLETGTYTYRLRSANYADTTAGVTCTLTKDNEPVWMNVTIEDAENGRIEARYDNSLLDKEARVPAGAILSLKAIPDQNFRLASWWDGNTDTVREISIWQDTTISAAFEKDLPEFCKIYFAETTGGSIVGTVDGEYLSSGDSLPRGSEISLTAIAEINYTFVQWWDENTDAVRKIVLMQDTTISAVFQKTASVEDRTPLHFEAYPNPSDGIFFLKSGKAAHVDIFGFEGRKIKEFEVPEAGTYRIDLSGRAAGLYYLRIVSSEETSTIKIILR